MHEFRYLVQQVVESPSFVSYDTDNTKREIYYREGLPELPGELFKVVVDFGDPELGTVITAYPVTKPKAGENRRWPPPH
jgi:Cu2+-containing amine oxidase